MERERESRKVGLARALSKLGYCSRSQAIELIRGNRVSLNGKRRSDPETPVRLGSDRIDLDGIQVGPKEKIYLMLNKPRGVVTTASDEKGRRTVYDFLDDSLPWVAPVGRLDKASEGLLLLTNDSEWAARISNPTTHIDKTYHVQINFQAERRFAASLVEGVRVDSGEIMRAKRADVLRTGERNSWIEIVLDEGKNRQIRRMLEHYQIEVLRLVRVAVGSLPLGQIAKGKYRHLTPAEKRLLYSD